MVTDAGLDRFIIDKLGDQVEGSIPIVYTIGLGAVHSMFMNNSRYRIRY